MARRHWDRPRLGRYLGPGVGVVMFVSPPPAGMQIEAWWVAAIAVLMAAWWITEAIPLAATALLPFVLLPTLNVVSVDEVGEAYANPVIFLFLGGFLLASAVQRWGLHRRLALLTIAVVGTRPQRVVLGFMLASGGLSMWISNTATAMMMLPIALSVAARGKGNPGFPAALMLATAYGASIGGVATLIGTPPNAILAGMLADLYHLRVGFAQWMAFGLPLSAVMMVVSWWYLTRFHFRNAMAVSLGGDGAVARDLAALGPITVPERRVAAVFLLVAALWVGRGLLPIGTLARVSDAGIAIAAAMALFVLPAGRDGQRLLDGAATQELPWDVLILFGGGFALAGAFQDSGLSEWIGRQLGVIGSNPLWVVVGVTAIVVLLLTELTSNTATAALLIPIIAGVADGADLSAPVLMVAVATAASYAFMLPVATPPNAVVFGSRCVDIADMVGAGLVLNLAGAIVITVMVSWWLPWVWPAAAGG